MPSHRASSPPRGLRRIILACLHDVPGAAVDDDVPFAALGLDSLRATELARRLAEALGTAVSPTVFYEHPTVGRLIAALTQPAEVPAPLPEREPDVPVAVIGVACRLPGADGPDALWQLLHGDFDAVREIPAARWPASVHDPAGRRAKGSITRHAAMIDGVDQFEPEFFGISPREAVHVDPQQRILLELAWEALEHAGLPPDGMRDRPVGVFVGGMSMDYGELTWEWTDRIPSAYGPGSALTMLSNRISYALRFTGPSLTVDTACASSLTALHLACQSLRRGEAELAVAGGVILHLRPNGFATMSRLGALAPDGRSKAFSAAADGYGRGEGGALLVLKPLAAARRDGDNVLAVVRGSAINHNGASNGVTAPSPHAQAAVIRAAWAAAGVSPAEAGYVEAHGTGTALGDPLEAEALGRVFGALRPADDPRGWARARPTWATPRRPPVRWGCCRSCWRCGTAPSRRACTPSPPTR
ncbi:MAG: type I polyketide synthase [Myxococcota bacterium]